MSRWIIPLIVAGLCPAMAASAADVAPPVSGDPPEVEISDQSISSGWYLRSDLGFTASLNANAPDYRTFDATGQSYQNTTFDSFRFGKSLNGSAGVGYRFNEWLRADVSADYFSSGIKASSTSPDPCASSQPAGTTCSLTYSSDYTALGLMANASVDLGTVVGITPYVSGGIGAYHVDWGKTRENAFCVNGSATCSSSSPQITAIESMPDWRFAYHVGAGLSFEIAPKTVLDVNYRYSRMTGGPALKFSSEDMAAGSQGAKAVDHDLTRHEIRAGLRILLW